MKKQWNLWIAVVVFALIPSGIIGCASARDELSRAQQEVDTRQYDRAIQRLEQLGEGSPETRETDEYLDLLSSAYLGRSGVDLIDALGHWAETAKSIEGVRADIHATSAESPTAVSFQEYKAIVHRLVPPELNLQGHSSLQKALTVCNRRLEAASAREAGAPSRTISKRLLVKIVFVNFWGLLNELNQETLPGAEMLLAPQSPREVCAGLSRATASFQKVTEYDRNIALAVALLGDHPSEKLKSIHALSQLAQSMSWIKQAPTCEHLSHDDLERIKQRFAGN